MGGNSLGDIIKLFMDLDKKMASEMKEAVIKTVEKKDNISEDLVRIEENYRKKLKAILDDEQKLKQQEYKKSQAELESQYKARVEKLIKTSQENKDIWIKDISKRCTQKIDNI